MPAMPTSAASNLDLPLITEATNDYYRNIYADPDLGPIFKGINMVVLRTHVSFFIHQVAMFDKPLSPVQLDYLRRVHTPIIKEHKVTQRHYEIMLNYLMEAMRTNGAEEDHLQMVQSKLQPLRDLFPPAQQHGSEDGQVVLHEQQEGQQPAKTSDPGKPVSETSCCPQQSKEASSCKGPEATCCPQQAGAASCQAPVKEASSSSSKQPSWLKHLLQALGCMHASEGSTK